MLNLPNFLTLIRILSIPFFLVYLSYHRYLEALIIFIIGGVTDFLNIGIGSLRTGIFNVADVWIMLGAGLLFLARDFREPKEASETS